MIRCKEIKGKRIQSRIETWVTQPVCVGEMIEKEGKGREEEVRTKNYLYDVILFM